MSHARKITFLSSLYTYLPDVQGLPFGYFFFFSKLYVTFILLWITFIFNRNEEEDQYACCMQERQLLLPLLCTCLL